MSEPSTTPRRRPYVIGVTGTICSGKSRLCRFMAELGVHTIDCDEIGHELLQTPAVAAQVVAAFGPAVLAPDGAVARDRLGRAVFGRPDRLEQLNRIMWGTIEATVLDRLDALARDGVRLVAVEAALLIKTDWFRWIDTVWVTTLSPAITLERLTGSRGMSRAEARRRIASQPSSFEYAQFADLLFDTRYKRRTIERVMKAEIEHLLAVLPPAPSD